MLAAMFTVERHVGRLVETRLDALDDVAAVDRFGLAFLRLASEMERVVIVGDYRRVRILPPEVAARFVGVMARTNPKVVRSAILLDAGHATFGLQIERMVREAGTPSRRTFRAAPDLVEWLGEELLPDEKAQLVRFLDGR